MPCIHKRDGSYCGPREKNESMTEYEEKLLNKENEWSRYLKMVKFEGPCEKVSIEEVTETLNRTNA